ncbi:hypothetical protein EDB85DRAFT_1873612, partial [Lactarius pseudohatsudake]
YTSPTNSYGIYRVYKHGAPSYTPDDDFNLDSVADNPNFARTSSGIRTAPSPVLFDTDHVFGSSHSSTNPVSSQRFENPSIFRLMLWYHNSSLTKSLNDLNVLVQNVMRAPDFQVQHFDNFDAVKADEKLFEQGDTSETPLNHGWYETTVPISLACDKVTHKSERDAPILSVTGLYHRKPLEVIRAALQESNAQQFHIAPFEEYWVPHSDGPPERIYSELYNSNAYIKEHGIIHAQAHEDPLEAVIVSLMLWSDSTHLTSFGSASLWPIYLYIGNQSKYERAKPSTFSAHHLAYIPELDDSVQDKYIGIFGKAATSDMLTHLRRELMQSIWAVILDDEFMDAYAHGVPFDFQDGIQRRVYPRIFTYSADYPEKYVTHIRDIPS